VRRGRRVRRPPVCERLLEGERMQRHSLCGGRAERAEYAVRSACRPGGRVVHTLLLWATKRLLSAAAEVFSTCRHGQKEEDQEKDGVSAAARWLRIRCGVATSCQLSRTRRTISAWSFLLLNCEWAPRISTLVISQLWSCRRRSCAETCHRVVQCSCICRPNSRAAHR